MNDQTELFRSDRDPRPRLSHRDEVKSMKEKHGIFTHLSRGNGDWLALSMPECIERLKGYTLTDEEKTVGAALLAGYCRLLDDEGLIEENHRTEYEACLALVKRIETGLMTPRT
jgi:hypothetical protein